MIDTIYFEHIIKLKKMPNHSKWLAVIRNNENKTIAMDWHDTKEQGEQWAKNLIKKIIISYPISGRLLLD